MKAILCTRYGPPENLQYLEVSKPVPQDDEVLIKIRAASVNIADWYTLSGGPARLFNGLRGPKDPRLGIDFAGSVEAVGKNVALFHPGEEVFGACAGSFAEFACARENRMVLKPTNVSFEQAASLPVAAVTALQGLRDIGHIQPGQKVLIGGASGGVGTFSVQIAISFGAEVTAVCSPRHLDTARAMGADHIIDYTREDFTKSGQKYDLILAVNGYHPLLAYKRALTPTGTYVMAGASASRVLLALLEVASLGKLLSSKGGQSLAFMGIAKINTRDLESLSELLASRKIVPVIDRQYPLSRAGEALGYLGRGHPGGKIILSMGQN